MKPLYFYADINECVDFFPKLAQCDERDDDCLIQRCQECADTQPGFTCRCNNGYELWRGGPDEKFPMRLGENGLDITHVLAENVSCVRE